MTARWPHVAGRCQAATGMNMWSPLLLIALCVIPSALQTTAALTVDQKLEALALGIEHEAALMADVVQGQGQHRETG